MSGIREGEWKKTWVVIANEDLNGDPIFIDLDDSRLPVYTAPHGAGHWEPVLLASSFSGFID